ncbi:MAG TPA: o-succinylbenzoate--CoA ligase [Jiangellales bacterium]|nr:o-succinylbenzoate--CoA ligase [Jiangellales bacterium]
MVSPTPPAPHGRSGLRAVHAVAAPDGAAVLRRILPAVATALEGGPAVLPLPEGPPALRDHLLATLRPSLPVELPDEVDGSGQLDPVALVVPTSGSTGEPKGVMLGAAALRASATATVARLGGPGRWLLALPATHIGGLMVIVRSVLEGQEPVALDLSGGFDAESFAAASMRVLATSRTRRYTALVPVQLGRLLDAGGAPVDALCAYDAVLVGGAAISPRLLARAMAAGVNVVTSYGMTETCGGCVYDGLPLDGVRVSVAPDGRLRIGGDVLARGYRLQPELTEDAFAGGWFTTSDLGRVTGEGRVEVHGRMDDVALSGGMNVPLAAVDAVVGLHPGVAEVVAVALPDEEWGQRVVAVVVPVDPDAPPTLESVRAAVARRAPVAHAPRALLLVESLPSRGNGKPDRRAATDLARAALTPADGETDR